MIHLQQAATPVHEIVAGLCMGLARNLKSNLAGGRELAPPVALCGGVAANRGVVHALERVLELPEGGLIVPPLHAFTGALGAVHVALDERRRLGEMHGRPAAGWLALERLRQHLASTRANGSRLAPLPRPVVSGNGHARGVVAASASMPLLEGLVEAWLGLDVGSISTKVAVIDSTNEVLAKVYLMTAGRPIEAVRQALTAVRQQIEKLPFRVSISGAATTGSGRYLTGDVIGADLVINEITAQATAAAAIDSAVDTIFEIGGQDSKYIAAGTRR